MITMKIINDYGVDVEIVNGKEKQYKYFSMSKFQKCILSSYTFDTGLLPVGAIAYRHLSQGIKLAMIQMAGVQNVKYKPTKDTKEEEHEKYIVPLPPLLWIFYINQKKILYKTKLFALKTTLVMPTSRLYEVPLSNVYSDGTICWGDNNLFNAPMNTLVGLSAIPAMFFDMPFNSDLDPTIGGRNFLIKYSGCLEFPMRILEERKTFEEEWKNEN